MLEESKSESKKVNKPKLSCLEKLVGTFSLLCCNTIVRHILFCVISQEICLLTVGSFLLSSSKHFCGYYDLMYIILRWTTIWIVYITMSKDWAGLVLCFRAIHDASQAKDKCIQYLLFILIRGGFIILNQYIAYYVIITTDMSNSQGGPLTLV